MNKTPFQTSAEILKTEEFSAFAQAIRNALAEGGKVFFSGSSAAGRLGIRLERAWRKAVLSLQKKYPQAAARLEEKLDSIRNIDMAGEYSVIASPQCLSQSNIFGRGMMRANGVGLNRNNLFIAIDPAADTPSTLGSAHFVLIHLVPMYMLTCKAPVVELNRHTKEVFTLPYCRVLTAADLLTLEILCAVALESALLELCGDAKSFPGFDWFAAKLASMPSVKPLVYSGSTLCADEFLLDALCFAAEHPQYQVKNPNRETAEAWEHCFLRQPRCQDWPADFYQSLGFSNAQIQSLPNITAKGLLQIPIGKEAFTDESALNVDALLDGYDLPETHMEIFRHLAVGLLLNSLTN